MKYNSINGLIYQLAHKFGIEVKRFPTSNVRALLKYLAENKVNDCFDVGANIGQFASEFRSAGFKGNIISFEPQKKAFCQLKERASRAGNWKAENIGLGNQDGNAVINNSKNSVSSSILDIKTFLTDVAPETSYISREDIQIKRLDTFVKEIDFTRSLFLKIDAQGFEYEILNGATNYLVNIHALQVELSSVALYEGEKLYKEMIPFIESKGFYLSSLESGFSDPSTGRLLQVEAIFLKEKK